MRVLNRATFTLLLLTWAAHGRELSAQAGVFPQGDGREPRTGVLYADRFPGSDILAQATAAFSACSWKCTVVIPPRADGSAYVASSTLAIPLTNLLAPTLIMTNACIAYTGSGYAIDTYETQPNPSAVRLRIVDGCITGTAAALGAFRFLPTSDITISGTRVADFTQGDAVAIYGTENVNISGNYSFANNRFGVRIQGIFCRQGLPLAHGVPDFSCTVQSGIHNCNGSTFVPFDGVCAYAGNMVHVHDGALSNLIWDIYEQGAPGFEHLSNSYYDNEINGGGGGIFIEMGRGDRIASNYFESKSGRYIVLGNAAVQPLFYIASATSVQSNYFTTNGKAAISIQNGSHTSVMDNAELSGTPSRCFLDSLFVQSASFDNNKMASTSALCRNGHTNATPAGPAHFSGNREDPSLLDFQGREDEAGVLFLNGAAKEPTGACTVQGQWVPSRDGHLSVCLAGKWVRKL